MKELCEHPAPAWAEQWGHCSHLPTAKDSLWMVTPAPSQGHGHVIPSGVNTSPDTPTPPTLVPATAYLFILYMWRVFNISNPIITKFINRVRWSERLLAGEICL